MDARDASAVEAAIRQVAAVRMIREAWHAAPKIPPLQHQSGLDSWQPSRLFYPCSFPCRDVILRSYPLRSFLPLAVLSSSLFATAIYIRRLTFVLVAQTGCPSLSLRDRQRVH